MENELGLGKRLEGQVALITGGGGEIGTAIALRLASEGSAVVIGDSANDRAAHAADNGADRAADNRAADSAGGRASSHAAFSHGRASRAEGDESRARKKHDLVHVGTFLIDTAANQTGGPLVPVKLAIGDATAKIGLPKKGE